MSFDYSQEKITSCESGNYRFPVSQSSFSLSLALSSLVSRPAPFFLDLIRISLTSLLPIDCRECVLFTWSSLFVYGYDTARALDRVHWVLFDCFLIDIILLVLVLPYHLIMANVQTIMASFFLIISVFVFIFTIGQEKQLTNQSVGQTYYQNHLARVQRSQETN